MDNNNTSLCSFVSQIDSGDSPLDNAYENIFSQYEKVVINALATSFGLDFLIQDRYGGDVDTVNNVRKVGQDPNMTYKNEQNEKNYESREDYNGALYHGEKRNGERTNYANIKHETKQEFLNNGYKPIKDEYTGKENLIPNKNAPKDISGELDHIVEAKAIHDDAGRVLAGIDGVELADAKENFAWTNKTLNASMGSWARHQIEGWQKQCSEAKKQGNPPPPRPNVDMEAYINAHPEIDENTKKNMLSNYKKAKNAYDAKINRAYYSSKAFWKDTSKAAATLGLKMGLRQALGLVFTEIWFTVKDAILICKKEGKALLESIAKAVKQGLKNAKKKFRDIWDKFIEGAVAGVLSSLVTTLSNIFFTTAKNIIKIIRETYASLCEACKILFINPDGYPLGDRFVAAAKVLSTGASVVAGSMVRELLNKTSLALIPVIGDVVPTFCSILVTGIMSCSFLYILDHNKGIKKIITKLNNLPDIDNFNYSLKKQGELLDKYLAELMSVDINKLQREEREFSVAANRLSNCNNEEEINDCLLSIYKTLKIDLPWKGYASFDNFMNDNDSVLEFS